MPEQKKKEQTYSAGQVARMLRCSLRSLYRWEETGAIPKADRIDRGGVSARVYTESQIEELRRILGDRLSFSTTVLNPGPKLIDRLEQTAFASLCAQVFAEIDPAVHSLPLDVRPLFRKAMKFARHHGATSITIVAPDGKRAVFSKRKRGKDLGTR
jgi:hypothetical protein